MSNTVLALTGIILFISHETLQWSFTVQILLNFHYVQATTVLDSEDIPVNKIEFWMLYLMLFSGMW